MQKLIIPFVFLLFTQISFGQFFSDNKEIDKHEGFFDFYYEEKTGKVWLVVDRINSEFLYVNALSQGLGSNDIGLDRGQLGGGVVVKFVRSGGKLLLVQPNQRYRAITENQLEKKSIEEAFAKSVLFGFEIKEEKDNKFLVEITSFLIRDAHGVAERLKSADQGSYKLEESRSAMNMERTKAFPKNVEFDAILTFTGEPKAREIRSVSPNAQSITSYQHHSFVELPDNEFKPRVYDPRSGSYPMSYMDYATAVNKPIVKRFIYKHRLEKKNPGAEKSEAKEPIIYYLDPGTPEPVRSALLEGASWWNQAFEAAGYTDAFQVKMLPPDADLLDLRYNVIQWVHRSTRGWSYGSSISDPRTGEIIKGHVSLGSLRIRQDFMIAQALQAPYQNQTSNDDFALQMALSRIRQLSAHEVGHTLGFSHNFAASTRDRCSVMDYPHPWIKANKGELDFSNAYGVGIGDWDKVAVTYSYAEFDQNEESELKSLLDKAFEQGHRYITDADARPAGSSNAYAHLWDNGNDIVSELSNVMEVRRIGINNFSADNIPEGQPYSVLEDVFVPLYFYHRYQTEAVSKLIGGTEYNYAIKGGGQKITEILSADEQRRALDGILETVSAEQLSLPESIRQLFPPRAFGYPRSRESFKSDLGVAFDPFGAASTASQMTFSFLLHPERASRLVAQKAEDKKQLGLSELISELIAHTYKVNHKDAFLQEVQNHINEQLLESLYSLASDQNAYAKARAIANRQLRNLATYLEGDEADEDQKALLQVTATEIKNFLKDPSKRKKIDAPKIPDGSPIGMLGGQ